MARKEGQESGRGCLSRLGSGWLGLCCEVKPPSFVETLPCTGSVLTFVPFAGRLGGREGLPFRAVLNQTPAACTLQQLVTVSGACLVWKV